MPKWVCTEYNGPGNGYGDSNKPTGQVMKFDTEEAAIDFYSRHRSAQRFAGSSYSPYWSYPRKVEE